MFKKLLKIGLVLGLTIGLLKAEILSWGNLVGAMSTGKGCFENGYNGLTFKFGDLTNGEGKCYAKSSIYIKFPLSFKFDVKNVNNVQHFLDRFIIGHQLKGDPLSYCSVMPTKNGFTCSIQYKDGIANLMVFDGWDYYAMNFTAK